MRPPGGRSAWRPASTCLEALLRRAFPSHQRPPVHPVRYAAMAAIEAGAPATETADRAVSRASVLRERLVGALPADRLWGWVGSLLVHAFGGGVGVRPPGGPA